MFVSDLGGSRIYENYRLIAKDKRSFKTGYQERDWEKHPYGFAGTIFENSSIKTIPRSEWVDRIEQKEKTRSRLSDFHSFHKVPILDQNGNGYCVTDDTEILTQDRGWLKFDELTGRESVATFSTNTHRLEFQRPSIIHHYEYEGPMVYSQNSALDFGVTPDHRMYVNRWDERKRKLSDDFSTVLAGDLGWYSGMMAAPNSQLGTELVEIRIPGCETWSGDDFIKFVSLIVSDGFASSASSEPNLVSFCAFRRDRRALVRPLALKLGFTENDDGVFEKRNKHLHDWVAEQCYQEGQPRSALTKKIPQIIKEACERQLNLFLDWYGDQNHNRPRKHYYTSCVKLADDIQELHLRIGKRCSICETMPKTSMFGGKPIVSKKAYTLNVYDRDRMCLDRKKHIGEEHYKGLVHCVTVPNGTMVTRRNGQVLMSHNCWAFGVVGAWMVSRAMAGLPTVHFSAASIAAQVKNYRDQGGWGMQAVDGFKKYGIYKNDDWPEQSRDRKWLRQMSEEQKREADKQDIAEFVELPSQSFDHLASCLLQNIPCSMALMWWGHLVYGLDLVHLGNNRFGILIANSWTPNWENNGMTVLRENKATAHEQIAVLHPNLVA